MLVDEVAIYYLGWDFTTWQYLLDNYLIDNYPINVPEAIGLMA